MGDSHSLEFSLVPNTCIHWVGSITMHRVGRDGLSILNLKNFGVNEGDTVVFCFGEIDVRCHIRKQVEQHSRSIEEVISTLTEKYMQTIKENRSLFNNITCVVYSVTPPTNATYNPEVPYFGSLADRVHLTNLLNVSLYDACQKNEINFLDVYNLFADKDGALESSYSDGNVHIRGEFLRQMDVMNLIKHY